METRVTWRGGMVFEGINQDGLRTLFDGAPGPGHRAQAATPMEVTAQALAACTGMDVVFILKKMRVPLEDLEVLVHAERAPDPPRAFTRIVLEYIFTGDLTAEQAERAVALSQETYCSVGAMLRKAIDLRYVVHIAPRALVA
ncbi:MAG: OsmC family protein [Armatimonadetes bacterium]|nr:OsmC family protein [Armatimonadota bacterium]